MGINSPLINLFGKFLRINFMLLKVAGTFGERNTLRNPAGVIALASLSVWIIGQWLQVIFYMNINRKITVQSIGSILSGYLAVTKGFSLIFRSQNLHEILNQLAIMWDEEYKAVKNRGIMLTTAKKAYKITFVYFVSCWSISIVFHLQPYKNWLYQYYWTKTENNTYNFTTVLQSDYPVNIHYPGIYIPIIIIEHFTMVFILIFLISSDTLFYQLLIHLCLHFKLLSNDLENIISKAAITDISNEEKHEGLQKLSKIVKRQKELYSLSMRVQNAFRSVFFVSMLVTSITICISLYQLQEMIMVGQFWQGVGQLSYGLILLSQVAIYCGCSNMLSHEAELVAIAAYNCPWPFLGKQFSYRLQFLMLRAQKTFRCTAYGLFRLDLPQLSKILSASITYFTLLNSIAKKK